MVIFEVEIEGFGGILAHFGPFWKSAEMPCGAGSVSQRDFGPLFVTHDLAVTLWSVVERLCGL